MTSLTNASADATLARRTRVNVSREGIVLFAVGCLICGKLPA